MQDKFVIDTKSILKQTAIIAVQLCLLVIGASVSVKGEGIGAQGPIAALPHWTDIKGQAYDAKTGLGKQATVFVFVSTQCPIANIYTPRLLALAHDFSTRGVQFFLVDSNTDDSLAALKRYAQERKFPFPVVQDKGATLADALNAQVTPQAVILDATGMIRYTGRIDDSRDTEKVTHADVREALEAILKHEDVAHPRTLAFGCAIFRSQPVGSTAGVTLGSTRTVNTGSPNKGSAGSALKVSYTRDVAKILNANCVVCHRAGEVAPFALENYQQARTWARAIKDYTTRRLMPPWKPVAGYGDFHDSRSLTSEQIAALANWADAGTPQGDPHDLPPTPRYASSESWKLGSPDMVLQSPQPYHLEADGKDVYRNFVMPADFKEDRYVTGFEFKPGNRAIVHHIVTYIDKQGASVKLDGKEKEPGYTVPGVGIGVPDADWGDVWAPGNEPRLLPSGTVVTIPAGAKLVMQVHYHKTGKPEVDASRMAIYFAHGAVDHQMVTVPLANNSFVIQPDQDHQEFKLQFPIGGKLPFDIHLHSIFPHMHMLGKEMKVVAKLPDGTTKPLIYIDDWDFNWQATYYYKEPILLPKGTTFVATAVYDNSARNPHQTSNPPREVRFGEQTTDEMCFCFLGLTIDDSKIEQALLNRKRAVGTH